VNAGLPFAILHVRGPSGLVRLIRYGSLLFGLRPRLFCHRDALLKLFEKKLFVWTVTKLFHARVDEYYICISVYACQFISLVYAMHGDWGCIWAIAAKG
jgi:hypothetical protein